MVYFVRNRFLISSNKDTSWIKKIMAPKQITKFLENDKISSNIGKYFLLLIIGFLCYLLYKSNPTTWQLVVLFAIILTVSFGYDLTVRYNWLSLKKKIKGGKNE